MREVRAYIKPIKMDEVVHALRAVEGVSGASVMHVHGFGRSKGTSERHRIEDEMELLAPHVRIELVCTDEIVEKVVEVIREHGHTGLRGDGIIVVADVDRCIRIATAEGSGGGR